MRTKSMSSRYDGGPEFRVITSSALSTMMRARLILLLISVWGISAQRPTLSVDEITSTAAPSISYSIPENNRAPLFLTFAVCSSGGDTPRIFITNLPDTDENAHEVRFEDGLATFSSHFTLGGVLTINNPSGLSLEIGLSSSSPIHQMNQSLPVLGDTTSSQAILFSYPLFPFSTKDPFNPNPFPSFPNYTLPAANMSQPPLPQDAALKNVSLVILPTSSSSDIPRTACYLSSQSSAGTLVSSSLWARDSSGFSFQYITSNLSPQTNYTAYLVDSSSSTRSTSGPIYFTTKSPSFPCTLAHSLTFCPSIAYSIPLDPPPASSPANFSSYTAQNLPSSITSPLLSYLANFTTVLSTFPCGREVYSPLVACTDCELEYRKWLCAITFPRCAEAPPSLASSWSPEPPNPSATGLLPPQNPLSLQHSSPLPALLPLSPSIPSRNPSFPTNLSQSTTTTHTLLPCIEQCYAVDRACPPFLKFKCPTARFNAGFSYALGYIDRIEPDGAHGGPRGKGRGWTGKSQDRWGNVWCLMV